MEKSAILHADLLDIVFEGRNKEYGAYELRRTYNRRLRLSIAVMLSLTSMLCIGQLLSGRMTDDGPRLPEKADVIIAQVDLPEEPPPPPPPPPAKPQSPQETATIKVTSLSIMPDDQVAETEMCPVEDQEHARIDVVTKKGIEDDHTVSGPPADGGRDIIEKPRPVEDDRDRIRMTVEIESQYPGGKLAWERFLVKNLHYPKTALEKGIEGKVVVKFVVDKEGNVSGIEVLSGAEELRDEAMRVVRKSGRWKPAIQNGYNVASYKIQPVVFDLGDE
jgi:periplasmic protein TonB